MRTPGCDEELASGFLFGEGLIRAAPDVGLTDDFAANTIEVRSPLAREPASRRFYTTSSCGVCGKGALEEIAVHAEPLPPGPSYARDLLAGLPDARAAGLRPQRRTSRHWAVRPLRLSHRRGRGRGPAQRDGQGDRPALLDGRLPLHDQVLCVSGRLSFELVQKAASPAPGPRRRGAPSSLAIALAADRDLTLCGFARHGRMNVYTAPGRVSG